MAISDIAEAVARFHDEEAALTEVPGAGSILSVQEGNFSDLDGQDACDRIQGLGPFSYL